ncbi:MAG: Crp/Fnr family transcriptional regulator [Hyphomicrobium zavarzinii]|jgi:CRP-like cAMP-binding protein|uniref:Crp/Fnr family transcriptional regulator n=1 Tax=Hyphomicrobium TaxID=81 RepID=UPI0003650936|nr:MULTISPECIES: Crp/Fnr family transcriptional regulator [Hyphomicrobium]MBL8845860.1 Crp/Fnr family transcriptional regulator [Hyphomicrobium zavarzinii]WBT39693.1 Crp/Fnr family transcriptional regulator [Hyphomicrobium sp. DMF-1]HML43390.1 Crp/Fnr family transcriptional regulator [Hyphomicrobium zavarzinii]
MDPTDWQIVRSTPLFGTMPQEVAVSVIGNQTVTVHRKGEMLFQQGESANSFFVVLDGWVKLYRVTPDGAEAVVGVFRRGETFAEGAMFIGGRYPVSAEVVTSSRLLRIDGQTLRRRIREQPDLALSMLASSSYHLKALVEQIEHIKLLSAPQRIADFLLRLCPVREGGCTIELPYEKALIANRLGMKPESLSRALGKLRPLGVSVDRENVTIVDIALLKQFIESTERGDEGF